MKRAACKDADPALFFPERGKHGLANEAKKICMTPCPVFRECGDYRERTNSDFGVWAGKLYTRKDSSQEDEA